MTRLEKLKMQSQLAAVSAAKMEQEYQLELKKEECIRLENAIKTQEEKILELTNLLNKEE
jgi:hypothetical protein